MLADVFTKYLGIVAFRNIMTQVKEYRRGPRHGLVWSRYVDILGSNVVGRKRKSIILICSPELGLREIED